MFACRFRQLTGLPCPSCGSTRAVFALLRLQPARALRLSPIAMVAGVLLAMRGRAALEPEASPQDSNPSLEMIAVVILALGLLRAVLVAAGVRTPFTSEHIDYARRPKGVEA